MKRKIFWAVFALILATTGYKLIRAAEEPKILTTNINMDRKTVNGGASESDRHNVFFSMLGQIAESISAAAGNNLTMLAAAANPQVKFVKITPGMRKEEIASLLQKKLSWDNEEKEKFMRVSGLLNGGNDEGYYYPDAYVISKKADGYEAGRLMVGRFNEKVVSRYASSTAKIISLDTAMKIASMLEREAGGKDDMRLISGIIWNRIFKDMTLDVDATLQYAKGNEKNWWPKVEPKDKFIDSPFNTYQNKGLTPAPISNPHIAAIDAALNPKKTKCIFYLHDKYRRIHCSATYKEHVKNIERYYGKK